MNVQLKNSEVAVLYRTNSQSRAIEEALRRMNIKYKIIGGLSFYQRKEIKDLIAYLRFSINHNDEESFKRIINYPRRGVGDTSVSKMIVAANDHAIPLWEVLENADSFLGGRAANAVLDFVTQIKRFKLELESKDAFEAATQIAKTSGILKEL